jgi:hypothetical protein
MPYPLQEQLTQVVGLCERHHGQRPRFGSSEERTLIWDWELAFRLTGREAFGRWLDGEVMEPTQVAKVLGLYRLEYLDLAVCLRHSDNTARTEELRTMLARVRDEGDGVDRPKALRELRTHLQGMEEAARANPTAKDRIGNGCARKWTVLTGLLSFANEQFPFIRYTNLEPHGEGLGKHLFGDIPWKSQPSGEQYRLYCERFDGLNDKLANAELGHNPLGVLGASAWSLRTTSYRHPKSPSAWSG